LNLNGLANEIADVVVFTNYFIYGIAAFVINPDGQLAASDVNADGFALTVADLVYLIRIVVGDAIAIPKVSPDLARLDMNLEKSENSLRIEADALCQVGAAHLVFKYSGLNVEPPELGPLAEGMEIKYDISDSEIRVLIYSMKYGQAIEIGEGDLLNINFGGFGEIALVEYSFATFHGDAISARTVSDLMPAQFKVSQNYPNPFNPTTSIDLALPTGGDWQLTIYNINGQLVRNYTGEATPGVTTVEWDGRNEAGLEAASGVYLYRATAGNESVTRKMMLLK